MRKNATGRIATCSLILLAAVFALYAGVVGGQSASQPNSANLPALPAAQSVPAPGPVTDGPYAPTAILPGGIVMPLYAPDSPHLNKARIRRGGAVQYEQVRARAREQHREHPQSFD
jgi:hypothetical protein